MTTLPDSSGMRRRWGWRVRALAERIEPSRSCPTQWHDPLRHGAASLAARSPPAHSAALDVCATGASPVASADR